MHASFFFPRREIHLGFAMSWSGLVWSGLVFVQHAITAGLSSLLPSFILVASSIARDRNTCLSSELSTEPSLSLSLSLSLSPLFADAGKRTDGTIGRMDHGIFLMRTYAFGLSVLLLVSECIWDFTEAEA